MVIRLRDLLCLMVVSMPVFAAQETGRLLNENLYVHDSDDADQQAHYLGVGLHPTLMGRPDQLGLWYGRWLFNDPVGNEDFDAYRVTYETALQEKVTTVGLRLLKLQGDDWSPWLGGATLTHAPEGDWRFEASVDRELIDSVPALRQRLTTDNATLSVDWHFAGQWTVVGALLHQSIEDGNERRGGLLRLIYEVPHIAGLSLQTKSRFIRSDFDGNGYFSPPRLEEHLLLVGYARSLFDGHWSMSALAGPGTQRFEDDFSKTRNDLYYAELKLRGWFTDQYGLEGRAFCSNSGGPNEGAPDDNYRYCNLLFTLIRSW